MNPNDPAVSVVVPVRNEAGNIAPLVAEIAAALDGQWRFEVIYVNDGSSDGTEAELKRLMGLHPWLRRVRHRQSCGQSAAVRSGVTAARAPLIVTLDGDGQNDPAFIPALLRALEAEVPGDDREADDVVAESEMRGRGVGGIGRDRPCRPCGGDVSEVGNA